MYTPPPQDPPLLVDLKVSRAVARIGDPITWTARPSGGNGDYSYSWSGTDGLTGTDATLTTTYRTPGSKTATVTVVSGNQRMNTLMFTAIEAPPPPPVVFGARPAVQPLSPPANTNPTVNPAPLPWATHTLYATTGWEPSYQAAQTGTWRALRDRVMALPVSQGETVADLARRDPQLGDRVSREIPVAARTIKVEYLPNGAARIQVELPLGEISEIIRAKNLRLAVP